MLNTWITVRPDHTIDRHAHGMDWGTDKARVVGWRYGANGNLAYLVIDMPGHTYWNGRGSRRYAAAETWFCQVVGHSGDWNAVLHYGKVAITSLIELPKRRKED